MLDTSALGQRSNPRVKERLASCIQDGAWVCDMVVAESLIRSRSKADFRARRRFFETFEVLPVDQGVWEVVTDLAVELSMGGVIVSSGDVIIGACARLHDLTVVHYDSDYEVLGRMCGVQHDWVVAAGSL